MSIATDAHRLFSKLRRSGMFRVGSWCVERAAIRGFVKPYAPIPKSFGQALRNSKTTSKSANATRLQELLSAEKGLAEGKPATI